LQEDSSVVNDRCKQVIGKARRMAGVASEATVRFCFDMPGCFTGLGSGKGSSRAQSGEEANAKGVHKMEISSTWMGIIAIVFGILVLAFPELLHWLVGVFLVVAGIVVLIRK
jgi:hypothetical protein